MGSGGNTPFGPKTKRKITICYNLLLLTVLRFWGLVSMLRHYLDLL